MSSRFRNRYRATSTRLPNRDYGKPGAYFVTLCTHQRLPYFGTISNDSMARSPIGDIAHDFWIAIPDHHPHVRLDNFVIMPNHTHGIVIIDRFKNDKNHPIRSDKDPQPSTPPVETANLPETETANLLSLHSKGYSQEADCRPPRNQFGPQPSGSLQTILQSYKAAVTRWCRKNGHDNFGWQSRYYDHVIRNDGSLDRIRQYIVDNPRTWAEDVENPAGLWM